MKYIFFEFENTSKIYEEFMKKFKYVSADGFWDDTLTKALVIKFNKKKDFEEQKKEVLEFLPHVPFSDSEIDDFEEFENVIYCVKRFELDNFFLYEDYYGDYGTYLLLVLENGESIITDTIRHTKHLTFPTIEEALKFVHSISEV
jgi:hypothetical protein